MSPILEMTGLQVSFGPSLAVDGIDLHVAADEVLGLVGESGSGKTMASLSMLRLVPSPGRITAGRIAFEGRDLLALPPSEMAALRGKRIAMVFQNPAHSLDPLLTIGTQLGEIVRWHERVGRKEAQDRVAALLQSVGLSDPLARLKQFPHEMSGGMKQRVCIARALLCNPALLLADEPTTALDVTIQAQILDLLREVKRRTRTAMVLVTHDMGVVARMADRVTVMYAGRICETADVRTLFRAPLHPYTTALLESVPRADRTAARVRLPVIGGRLPDARHPPAGCRFHPRCPEAIADCALQTPIPTEVAPGHIVSCIRRGSRSLPVAA
ncbi:ABC transporter ATP-binding protein [Acidisphaera sp. L21]|uniref:ABC transporter ATP-binding protein n=1 Tax=Acidisphaera sp. L21 TaxID=1641851 RepID=UPI001C20C290|nr:ABC transporter ATP-binding protein [Acidisphaera sp. L21]